MTAQDVKDIFGYIGTQTWRLIGVAAVICGALIAQAKVLGLSDPVQHYLLIASTVLTALMGYGMVPFRTRASGWHEGQSETHWSPAPPPPPPSVPPTP